MGTKFFDLVTLTLQVDLLKKKNCPGLKLLNQRGYLLLLFTFGCRRRAMLFSLTTLVSHNLISATTHASELKAKIDDEIASGRMWGPSAFPPFSNLHVSPVGLVPKADRGWRIITHLSSPPPQNRVAILTLTINLHL